MSDTHSQSDSMTRRHLLIAAAGGAVGVAATAWGVSQIPDETRAQLEKELDKLRAVVKLYESLENIGLDNILANAMSLMRGLFDALKTGVRLLRDGVAIAESAWKNFQAILASLRVAVERAAQVLADLQQKFKAAEGIVVAVLGSALPLAESIGNFFNTLISKIPFGIGDELRRAINALVELVRAIPATIETISAQLLKLLNDTFFPPTGKATFNSTLMDPITQNVFDPLRKFLDDVDNLVTRWEKDFTKPVQSALDQRQMIRKQIAEYRQQYNV